ncbi:LysR family transcriptional regulator [Rhodobacteraceae bacterium NNCM2]|nr:LysR family transcriptional regulator [Coraliihabitans acroporae]
MDGIADMTKRNLDSLHLLPSFRAIMEEGSVVAAADRLGLTQSAVSKHLSRLREWFGDPLFVRTSSGMQPTPRAIELASGIDALLTEAEALTDQPVVSPASFTGTFTLSSTDEVLCRILPRLLPRLAEAAPDLRLTAVHLAPDYSLHGLETGSVNLLVTVNWHAPDMLRQARLFQDRFVVAMHVGNPLTGTLMTPEVYAAARHVLVAPLGMGAGVIDEVLARQGLTRRVVASVPGFSNVTPELLGTNAIVTLPERVALRLAASGEIVLAELPVSSPPIVYHALWHPRYDREPRLRWMRGEIQRVLSGQSDP